MSHALPERNEDRLRRALLAAAEGVDPSDDGLAQIQLRLGEPLPAPLAWFAVARTRVWMRLQDLYWSSSDLSKSAVALTGEFVGAQRDRIRRSKLAGRSRVPGLTWMRPGVAMGVVVFIVAAAVYMAIEVPQELSPSSNATGGSGNNPPLTNGGSSGNGGKTQTGKGTQPISPSTNPGSIGPVSPSPSRCPSPTSSLGNITSASPSTSTKPSQSPSPTPSSGSPSPSSTSGTPSPSPSATSPGTIAPSAGAGTTSSVAPNNKVSTARASGHHHAGAITGATTVAYTSPCTSTSPAANHRKHKKHTVASTPSTGSASGLLQLPAIAATEAGTGIVN